MVFWRNLKQKNYVNFQFVISFLMFFAKIAKFNVLNGVTQIDYILLLFSVLLPNFRFSQEENEESKATIFFPSRAAVV
jgi:hypothetical protein